MRKTENFELNLLDGEDFVNKDVLNDNAEKIDQKLKEHDTPEYDTSLQKDVENLSSGESLKVALRKLAKAVADYISHKADQVVHITAEERTAWNAKLGADKIAANLTTTTEGMVLAAAMGKTLKGQIDKNATDISTLNSNFEKNVDIINYTDQISKNTDVISGMFSTNIEKVGRIATFAIDITVKAVSSSDVLLGTLPEGVRPHTDVSYNTLTNNGDACYIYIDSDGKFGIRKISTTGFEAYDGVRFCANYITKE